MKKVKIMLFSLAILAIVGGALAFKTGNGFKYCTAAVEGPLQTCGNPVKTCPNEVFSTTVGGTDLVCYTLRAIYTIAEDEERFGCATNTGNWQMGDYGTSSITCQVIPQQLVAD